MSNFKSLSAAVLMSQGFERFFVVSENLVLPGTNNYSAFSAITLMRGPGPIEKMWSGLQFYLFKIKKCVHSGAISTKKCPKQI